MACPEIGGSNNNIVIVLCDVCGIEINRQSPGQIMDLTILCLPCILKAARQHYDDLGKEIDNGRPDG